MNCERCGGEIGPERGWCRECGSELCAICVRDGCCGVAPALVEREVEDLQEEYDPCL